MTENPAAWTIDRLARLTAAALSAGAHAPQPNGRIREVPDVRTIRWYTSIGLLDRPAAMRGRTALYGRRHLAQLVAIKRLQAEGLTLTEVQERLLGADAAVVEQIAMLPTDAEGLCEPDDVTVTKDSAADGAAADEKAIALDSTTADAGGAAAASSAGAGGTETPTADGSAAADAASAEAASRARFWSARPTAQPASPDGAPEPSPTQAPSLLAGVRLGADVALLLPPGRVPDAAERAAIAEAARPLLDLLRRLGLSEA